MTNTHAEDQAYNGSATEFWEGRYQQSDAIWSGRPNATLIDLTAGLRPGSALDLGCGEGGDSLWLAERGWQVTGIDISPTALERARRAAADRSLTALTTWQCEDLSAWVPARRYDLVSSHFLHSPVEFARESILRRAADAVAPGGVLLVVGHAEVPPWSEMDRHHDVDLPLASQVHESLGLDDSGWTVLDCRERPRLAVAPDGQDATLVDSVLMMRRE